MPVSVSLPPWTGGLNTAQPPSQIGDHELSDCMNFMRAKTGLLENRDGVVRLTAAAANNPGASRVAPINGVFQHWVDDDYVLLAKANDSTVTFNGEQIWRASSASIGSLSFSEVTLPAFPSQKSMPAGPVTFHQIGDTVIVVGVGGTSGANNVNPVEIVGLAGSATAMTVTSGTAPAYPLMGAVWNNRLWLVSNDGKTLHGSDLGTYTAWDGTGAAGAVSFDFDDDTSGPITALFEWRDRLMVAKRDRIYYIQAGSPNTDKDQYEKKSMSEGVGVLNQWCWAPVLDDVVIFSNDGVRSLAASQTYGDFETVRLSRKVEELDNYRFKSGRLADYDQIRFHVDTENSLAFVAVASSVSAAAPDTVYVLDYRDGVSGGWYKWDGAIAGGGYCGAIIDGVYVTLVGGPDGGIYAWNPGRQLVTQIGDDPWDTAYGQSLPEFSTAAYGTDNKFARKVWHRFHARFRPGTATTQLQLVFVVDERITRKKVINTTLTRAADGSLLGGTDVLGSGSGKFTLGIQSPPNRDYVTRLRGSTMPRNGQSLKLRCRVLADDEQVSVLGAALDYETIGGDVFVTEAN